MTFVRSLFFNIVSFAWTFALLFLLIPILLLPRALILAAIRYWIAGIFAFQRAVLHLDFEFRGLDNLPEGPCIIASAHQSAWDTVAFCCGRRPCIRTETGTLSCAYVRALCPPTGHDRD